MKALVLIIALSSIASGYNDRPAPELLAKVGQYAYFYNPNFLLPATELEAYCTSYGFLPAAIPDAAQNQQIYAALYSKVEPFSVAAIGLKFNNETFAWLDGFTKYEYNNARNDTDTDGDQLYGIILHTDGDLGGKWTPVSAKKILRYALCEKLS
ncbi:unnamed protein product [Bursaphelenchus xylophilus]|nr:unnamed protein product [Bursaphelenchus xylophilus]CAG9093908.1 unnamed protein product [Bursaphelenchus xylophilus]